MCRFANMNVSKRFALNKDSLGNGILGSIYADFYNDGVSGVRFCRYGDKSLTDVATQDLKQSWKTAPVS